jgi:PAS domain S-box-containing protein
MAASATTDKSFVREQALTPVARARQRWVGPRATLQVRQIALITLLVALVVLATTVVNVAQLTGVIINSTQQEASQLSQQVSYAVSQEIANNLSADEYAAVASANSRVRSLIESTIVSSRAIAYVYITNVSGQMVTDSEGKNELAANRYMIGDLPGNKPDLRQLADESGYVQLARILLGPPIYEYRERLESGGSFSGVLHIGLSSMAVRRGLLSPVLANLFIGLLAILGAALVAISSANLLLRPLEAISTSIDGLRLAEQPDAIHKVSLPRDEMVTGVATRLRQLGERLAGERSELEIMRGRLRQVISHLEERLLLLNREGRVILASPDAEQILGVNDLELTGLPLDESLGINHPLVSLIERAFSDRRNVPRTTLQIPGRSRTRQLLASVQYIEDAGEPAGALVSMRDYDSFQKYESQWDLSKKLADLGRITSGIAHEVKNPLNAMVIHLEILRSKLETGVGSPTAQLEILDSEIKRLDRVVQTFLTFTRPMEINLRPIDLNAIIKQVVALASTEATERGVTINKHVTEGPLIVEGDPDLLTQSLLNIIINGCQAMAEGGPLKVTSQRAADGTARVAVTDRGVGIADEARERIFNLYYTTKRGGTGIGLAQAFRAVQLHGGSIRFESEVGVGTTFEIVLPAPR